MTLGRSRTSRALQRKSEYQRGVRTPGTQWRSSRWPLKHKRHCAAKSLTSKTQRLFGVRVMKERVLSEKIELGFRPRRRTCGNSCLPATPATAAPSNLRALARFASTNAAAALRLSELTAAAADSSDSLFHPGGTLARRRRRDGRSSWSARERLLGSDRLVLRLFLNISHSRLDCCFCINGGGCLVTPALCARGASAGSARFG